jgi:hypothetical protein
MPNKKLNAKLLWMQFEDVLAPRLGLTVKERAVYSYLLRHSLVVGKLRLQFAVMSLARTLGLSIGAPRQAVRRLDELAVLRVLKRSKTGHLAEMRLPEKIRARSLQKTLYCERVYLQARQASTYIENPQCTRRGRRRCEYPIRGWHICRAVKVGGLGQH